jgi:hypothetical protein
MGVRIEDNIPEKCDMLRELEKARANLCEKDTQKKKDQDKENSENLPLEEMKFIEWKSDSSDDEGYHLVTSRKQKKLKRRIQKQKGKGPKKGLSILLMRQLTLGERHLDLALDTTSGKGLQYQKSVKNDMNLMEL